ncbi:ribonuclease HII [Arenicella xantha]|uniref:Ribonuclease HII n=1 Tax=Arenicella xantha TaxID=644221 RepID=A0A395JJI0_9GAMM|nr:ribonuclease HII [Arenicella xantha]RBP50936.1 RNase HII [Arenicella xantha]
MIIAGVDEVGRGPLAGPVVTAAVILPDNYDLPGLTDSKKLTARRRELLSSAIKEQAVAWTLGEATVAEIDTINILQATMLAMQRAVVKLNVTASMVLVDGNRCPDFGIPARAVIGGDGLEPCISAASIIAKVARDQLMKEYALEFPNYGFDRNSGYPTKQHRDALVEFGVTRIHRRSFAPVKALC